MLERLIPSTMIYRALPLPEALSHIRAAGFETAELCIVGGMVDHYAPDKPNPETAVRAARDAGVKIASVNYGFHQLLPDGTEPADRSALFDATLDLTSALGADKLTLGSGPMVAPELQADALAIIADRHRDYARRAKARGVKLLVEAPHKLSIAQSPEEIAAYWRAMDAEIGVTLDCAHIAWRGDDPTKAARLYAPRVGHAHLRDAVPGDSRLEYGLGGIDFKAFTGALAAGGFDGLYSLEFPAETAEEGDRRLRAAKDYFAKLYGEAWQ